MLATKFYEESSFAPPAQVDGAIFLDRNPETFVYVLEYLRNGCQTKFDIPSELLKRVEADADYFGLKGLKKFCSRELNQLEAAEHKKKNAAVATNKYHKVVECAHILSGSDFDGWEIERVIPDLVVHEDARVRRRAQVILSKTN